jgi:hypothetical protein
MLFGTRRVCVAVASWWSWRDRNTAARAKASEAGRLLVGGLAAVVLLHVASSSQPAANQVLTNSNVGAVLIATALAVALGTGYTKYAEAMATDPDPDRPPPRSSIPPARRAGAAATAKAYRASLIWAIRPRPRAEARQGQPTGITRRTKGIVTGRGVRTGSPVHGVEPGPIWEPREAAAGLAAVRLGWAMW